MDSRSNRPGLTRRQALSVLAGVAAIPALATLRGQAVASGSRASKRPNLLWILTDQQHAEALSFAGSSHLATPAMDELFRTGRSFRKCYCPSSICAPSRAAMMTGRAPAEAGVIGNAGLPRLAEGVPHIGEWFAAHSDYECLYAGKWHLPGTFQTQIPGFEVLASGLLGHGNVSDTAAAEACAAYLLNRRRDRPFLLIVSLLQPHDICEWLRANLADAPLAYPEIADQLPPLPDNFAIPVGEPGELESMRRRDEPAQGRWSELHWRYYRYCYYRYVEQVDARVATVLNALTASGERENTLIVFNSDHGEGLAEHQLVRKESPYDASSRVPLVVTWPGRLPAADVRDSGPVSGLDVVPTLCEAGGIPAPPHSRGRSLLRADADAPDRTIVCDIPDGRGYVVRDRRYKLVVYREDGREMLFDCDTDPGEQNNRISDPAYAVDRVRLHAALRDWLAALIVGPSRASGRDARHREG